MNFDMRAILNTLQFWLQHDSNFYNSTCIDTLTTCALGISSLLSGKSLLNQLFSPYEDASISSCVIRQAKVYGEHIYFDNYLQVFASNTCDSLKHMVAAAAELFSFTDCIFASCSICEDICSSLEAFGIRYCSRNLHLDPNQIPSITTLAVGTEKKGSLRAKRYENTR